MANLVLEEAEEKMKKTVEATRREFNGIRTGRATPALLDRITVDVYGTQLPLNQVATISVPEARLLMISPWDKSTIPAIERSIMKSDLGLNPSSDGNVIRLAIPQLTEERRRDLTRVVHKKAEEGKVAIRNVRREANEELKKLRKASDISEDEEKRAEERVQKLTDKYISEIDRIQEIKEQEVLEV
ncbi:MAG TPA: ribosome recycling factor [Armatimonadota bacterium]|nr:ribosome recycling factor [Armatimonadota bacterium]HOM82729.1 ribosome recycling factor [Armatimonadota bacterium]HPO73463.1 ribosome recycling factor [Armatimonadota bacterium]HPT97451.1 ribosome recycling factor [Armatimonadota bacterium]